MEKPTYTAIDYNSKENKVIEGLVRDNYSKIKNTFYRVFDKRSKNPNSPVGLCADLIEAWWLRNLQMWYVFFYEKKGNKVRGVLGRERTNDLLGSIL